MVVTHTPMDTLEDATNITKAKKTRRRIPRKNPSHSFPADPPASRFNHPKDDEEMDLGEPSANSPFEQSEWPTAGDAEGDDELMIDTEIPSLALASSAAPSFPPVA